MRQEEIEGYRLSPQQQRLWRLQPDSRAFRSQCALMIRGPLRPEALEDGLCRLVERHEILRTAFRQLPGMELPLQVITNGGPLRLRHLDLSGCPAAERERRVEEYVREEREQPFDYERGQVVRAGLVRLAAEQHLLVISAPALCADVRTLQNLTREVWQHYEASIVGGENAAGLSEVVQYVQFSEWQQELLASDEGAEGRQYWREQEMRQEGLAAPRLALERDGRVEESAEYELKEVRRELGAEVLGEVEGVAERQQSSAESVLLACWQGLLWRVGGAEEFVVQVALDGRKYEDLYESFGLFTKHISIRSSFLKDSSLNDLIRRIDESFSSAYEWQEYYSPGAIRGLGSSDAVGYEYAAWDGDQRHGQISVACADLYSCTERFKLKLSCQRLGAGLRLQFHYDPQVYERAGIERLADQYVTLLASAVAEPEQLVSRLAVVGAAERQQILVEWNETAGEYPRDKCIHQLFEEQVERTPEAEAVVSQGEAVSYRELNERANQLAHHLRSLGVGPEVVVGVCLERSIEMVVAVLGILKAGGAYLPLEPEYPLERLSWMLEDAGVRLVVTRQALAGLWPGRAEQLLSLDTEAMRAEAVENPAVEVSGENLAYVIYTSGSTGRPKGVMIRHGSAVNLWMALEQAVYAGHGGVSRVSLNAPLSFDASVKQLLQLLSGHTLCLVPEEVRREPAQLGRYLLEQRVEVFDTTPAQLRQLLGEEGASLPEVVLVGGEAIDEALAGRMSEWRASTFYNVYGPTECTVDATARRVRAEGGESVEESGGVIGRPIANVQVYVLDDYQQLVPIGVSGEIYLGGEGLARGYLNRPELTAERFIAHPFSTEAGARLYRTGDVGRYKASGEIEYLGRLDQQVKVRGYRIELGEIEAVLSEHQAVEAAVVVAREDVPGEKRLVAYLVMGPGGAADIKDVRQFLREKLPEYMIPSAFVILPSLPLTRHGKVDRAALPAPEQMESREGFVAPRTPIEELLVNLYAEVLHVERVSAQENFFELGGHSLLATQLISRIREVFQLEVPLRLLFERPSVALLAEGIETLLHASTSVSTAPPIERVSRSGPLPLSFAQQRLWFIDQLEAGSPFYNSPAAVRLTGALDLTALGRTFTEVVRRHEVLRTHFAVAGGEPVQVIAEVGEVRVPVTDLSQMVGSEREAEVERLAREEAQRPFDLSRGPVLRVSVLRLGEGEHIMLLTLHHIVSDAWSLGVLTREVAALYRAYSQGEPSPLAELPVQYADYAAWQREWLTGDVLESQLSYWRGQLSGGLPVLELPTDHPRPSVQSYRGGQLSFTVGEEVTEKLKALSRREGATLFMTLLGAFQVLLMRYSGQEDVIVGTDIANRTRTELEALIGFFINQLVLRTDLSGDPTFEELIGRVREVCLGAYAHQDVPFEKLVEELQPERTLSHTPLFQVKFLLQNTPMESLDVEELRLEALHSDSGAARFDLTVALTEYEGRLLASAQYNADLFERETIGRMCEHFRTLLAGVVADPQQRLSQLPLLSQEERRQILVEWNATAREYPREKCVHELFEEQAERTPEAVAVLADAEQVSYRELNRRANQLAHHLRGLGVGPEVLVGVCLERSVEMVAAVLGVLKAGGAYLPLDPKYPLERLAWMLEDSNVPLLLTQEQLSDHLPTHWGQTICLDSEWERITKQSAENPVRIVAAENLAYVIYTSGSTGTPKGSMIPHRGLTNYLGWCAPTYALSGGQGALMHTSLGFDLSVTSLYAPLLVGQKVEILNGHNDVDALGRILQRSRDFSFIKLTPAHLALLSAQLTSTEVDGLTSVLVVGGENLLAETSSFWQRNAPSTRIFNEYGPTETVVGCCVHELVESDKHKSSIPIGRPIANTEIYILDRHQQVVPIGVTGEIYIGGEGLARCYLKRPDLTAERFIPHPYSSAEGARLYRTGDVGRYLATGEIEYLGRVDGQVKVRGYRIELGEVEAILSEHAAVEAAVVVAREDAPGDRRLVAYVVRRAALAVVAGGELRAYLRERLPEYMVPSAFVMLEELPLTPNGKVDRAALPRPDQIESRAEMVAPRTPVEEILANLYMEVLHVERVSVEDDFFELGGHSLLATQLVSRIREAFQLEVPLRAIFDYPTVAELSYVLEGSIIKEIEGLSDEEAQGLL